MLTHKEHRNSITAIEGQLMILLDEKSCSSFRILLGCMSVSHVNVVATDTMVLCGIIFLVISKLVVKLPLHW
jgi:hypothetical protein